MPQVVNSFNSGELTPKVVGRVDWPKYHTGCKQLQNFIVETHGGVTRRPGSTHLAAAKDADKVARLIPFVFSESVAYCLEFGDLYIRFYRNGVQLGAPYEVVTPYLESELRDLRFEQSADVMYIASPDHPTAILSRFADTTWTLVDVPFEAGPFLQQNDTDTTIEALIPEWETGLSITAGDVVCVDSGVTLSSATPFIAGDLVLFQLTYFITSSAHGLVDGDRVTIKGTVNYDGTYDVGFVATTTQFLLFVPYVAETFTASSLIASKALYKALTTHTTDSGGPPFETPPGNDTDWVVVDHFTGTNIILRASTAIFDSQHVGAKFKLSHVRTSFVLRGEFTAVGGSEPILITGDWSFVTHGTWDGTVNLQRSKDNGVTWVSFRSFSSQSDRNVLTDGIEREPNVLYRVLMLDYNSGTMNWDLAPDEANVSGIVEITEFVSTTEVRGTILETLPALAATKDWSEGAFSYFRGYPRSVSFYEERLVLGGNTYRPLTLWYSKTSDFHNMRAGTFDDDAIVFNLSSDKVNPIQWIEFQDALVVGTSGSEWQISSGESNKPITPSAVKARRHTTNGSANIKGTLIDDSILFVERTGRKLRELSFDFDRQGFIAPDLSIQAEHITDPAIVETGFSEHNNRIFWAVRSDGVLLSFTYDRIQEVAAWARHTTDGFYESIAVVPGTAEDQVYLSVKRMVNGSAVRHIELMSSIDFTDRHDAHYLDDALEFPATDDFIITGIPNGSPTTISAVAHGLIAGDNVRIAGVDGMTEVNDIWTVKAVTTNTFNLQAKTGTDNLDSTAFGTFAMTSHTITNVTQARQTVITSVAHGFANKQRVNFMDVVGMTELNNVDFWVFPIDADTFLIRDYITFDYVDTRFYNPYVSGGTCMSVPEGNKVENTFTGLSHLEGKLVQVMADGQLRASKKVVSGQITTDDFHNTAKVGLGYVSVLEPMPPENQQGVSQGVKSRITRVGVMLDKSMGFKIGATEDGAVFQHFQTASMYTDSGLELFTGYRELSFPKGYHDTNPIVLVQDKPLPLNIQSLIINVISGSL